MLLGPVFAAHAKQVGPVASAAHVPVVSFTTDRSVAGPGVYVMGILPSLQVERVVQLCRQPGASALPPWCQHALWPSHRPGLERGGTKSGGNVAAIEYYEPSAVDYSDVVQRLVDEGPFDALLIPEGGPGCMPSRPSSPSTKSTPPR